MCPPRTSTRRSGMLWLVTREVVNCFEGLRLRSVCKSSKRHEYCESPPHGRRLGVRGQMSRSEIPPVGQVAVQASGASAGTALRTAVDRPAQTIPAQPAQRRREWRAAAFICVIAIAWGLYWRARRAPRLTRQDTVVIADFDNKSGNAVFNGTLKQALSI